jgi:ATP-dependent helicase HepA
MFAYIGKSRTGWRDIARVVGAPHNGQVDVEYFRSPGRDVELVRVPEDEVTPIKDPALPAQTLIYVRDKVEHRWRIGRVDCEVDGGAMNGMAGERFLAVRFPNNRKEFVSLPDVFVRCPLEDDDPTELLAEQVTYTPYFAKARADLVRFAADQWKGYRGITALAAAKIEIFPHQIATATRVLSDPVQRYLLADEVGLGKTVEAGIIIRQHVMDEGIAARVLVIVPDTLYTQWAEELRDKLTITVGNGVDSSVRLVTFSQLHRFYDEPRTMVVVDEAHHIGRWRQNPDDDRYAILQVLARAERFLLLSGTPVAQNTTSFLAMLHLLDPHVYKFEDEAGFQTRIAHRESIAVILGELDAESGIEMARAAARELRDIFGGDLALEALISAVCEPAESEREHNQHRARLRSFVMERYRLDRRVLRTSRDHALVQKLLPTRRGIRDITANALADDDRVLAEEWLEEWRRRVLESGNGQEVQMRSVFARLVRSTILHPQALRVSLQDRYELVCAGAFEAFPEEVVFLEAAIGAIAQMKGHRELAVAAHIAQLAPGRRVIVFLDDRGAADAIRTALEGLAPQRVVPPLQQSMHSRINVFRTTPGTVFLCDRESEDGLNLQETPADVILFDMPLDASRIEQRLGRVDRLAGFQNVRWLKVMATSAYESAWAGVVASTIRPFDRSIARLQYYLADRIAEMEERLLDEGVAAFARLEQSLLDGEGGLEREFRRVRYRERLDAVDWNVEEEEALCDAVVAARSEAEQRLLPITREWLRNLQFETRPVSPDGAAVHFVYLVGHTLVPLQDWLMESEIGRHVQQPRALTFGPYVSSAQDAEFRAKVLGYGNPFFDRMMECLARDDRGLTWAMRRTQESPLRLYFRFQYLADLRLADHVIPNTAVRRRIEREALPPLAVEVWIDHEGAVVSDLALLRVLDSPYEGDDKNLNIAKWLFANQDMTDAGIDWVASLTRARNASERFVLDSKQFQDHYRDAVCANRARRAMAEMRTAARRHLAGGGDADFAAAAIEAALSNPRLRVLSVGAILLGQQGVA